MTSSVDFLGFDLKPVVPVEWLGGKADSIPNGDYIAKATSALRRPTKQCPNCHYWQLTMTIVSGDYEGHSLPVRFNTVHTNSKAQEIGRSQLRHYAQCIGNLAPVCESDLCGVKVVISVQNRKNKFVNASGVEVETTVSEVVRIEPYVDQSECNGSCPVPTNSSAQDEQEPF